jgi:hypothetical protein
VGIARNFSEEIISKESNYFVKIGSGSLGGKARGLLFLQRLLGIESHTFENHVVRIPKSLVICSDLFDEFLETTDLKFLPFLLTCYKKIIHNSPQNADNSNENNDPNNIYSLTSLGNFSDFLSGIKGNFNPFFGFNFSFIPLKKTDPLYSVSLPPTTDEVANLFLQYPLSSNLSEDLRIFLKHMDSPLAVRSSGMLEDSQHQPLAGIYATHMIPNRQNHANIDERFFFIHLFNDLILLMLVI